MLNSAVFTMFSLLNTKHKHTVNILRIFKIDVALSEVFQN